MDNVILKTKRTEMKFPLPFITPQILVDAINDVETIEFMDAISSMKYTQENAMNFIEFLKYTEKSNEELELGVFDTNKNRFIGMCTLEQINREHFACELGYWLDKTYVGNGYMTECAEAIIQYAKNELHMKTVYAFVITEHKKSIALLERLGFVRKELRKKDTENKGKEVDRYRYELIL